MSYSVPVNLIILFSFIIFVFYLLGIHNVLTKNDENTCEMTYMFEYPQYVEISLPSIIREVHPRYALYGYAEGGHTEQLRKMKFNGIPVLFIPGSSGSYKQGRSLASVSLRKWLSSRMQFHFDYFLVDFNNEQSGIYGGVLEDQTEFVRHCIKKILSLYKWDDRLQMPTSVIIIGHSVGGLIAKGVFNDPDFNPQLVHLIVTLATPHKHPIIQPDGYVASYYKRLDNFWRNNSNLQHITLVSIGGGNRDILVRSDITTDPFGDINVLSTAVPGVWCSNDHLSITWCKQLMLTIVRAMFDCIDANTKQLSTDKNYRMSVFKYHLLKRSAGKKFAASYHQRFASFERGGNWVENLQRQFTVMETRGLKANHYVMIRLLADPKHEMAFIESFNLNVKDWIFACTADVVHNSIRMCETGENLSNYTEIAPISSSQKLRRKFVYLNLLDLKAKSFTHVTVKLPPFDSFVQVNVDVHSRSERNITHQAPRIYSMSCETIIETSQDNSVYYNINLSGFESIWQAYLLNVDVLTCKTATSHAVVSFMVPWANEDQHFYSTDKNSISPILKLTTPKPHNWTKMEHPIIRLNLDPSCKYRISIKSSLIGSSSQIARYYTPMIPAYLATVILLTIRQQMLHLDNGECVLFHSALASAVRRYYIILQATILGSKVLGLNIFLKFLPVPDFFTLQELNLDFFVLTILLYGIAVVVVYSLGIVCYVATVISGQAAHKMALKFIARSITGLLSWSEWVFSALHQVPFVVAAFLVSLSLSTAGGLALWLGTFFYFLKLSKMYEDYLEDLVKISIKYVAKKIKNVTKSKQSCDKTQAIESKTEKNENEKSTDETSKNSGSESKQENANEKAEDETKEIDLLSSIHFHVSVFMLWFLTALIYVPSVLIWAKNYHRSVALEKDPGLIPSLIFSICGAVLWQPGLPYSCSKLSRLTSGTLFTLAAISIIYCSVSLYRLGYVLSAAVIVLTLNQLITRFSKK